MGQCHPLLHKLEFRAALSTVTLPDLPWGRSQSGASWGMVGQGQAQPSAEAAKASLLPATSSAPVSPHLLLPSDSCPPPPQDWGPTPAAECNSLPVLSGRARLPQEGSGCARASPCQDLAMVARLMAHVALQASPLPAAQPVGKLNRMSEIKLFVLLKQPGNTSFRGRGSSRSSHRSGTWLCGGMQAPQGFWLEEGGDGQALQEVSSSDPGFQRELGYAGQNWHDVAGFDPAPGQGSAGQGSAGQDSIPSAPCCSRTGRHREAPHQGPRQGQDHTGARPEQSRSARPMGGCPGRSRLRTAGTTESPRGSGEVPGQAGGTACAGFPSHPFLPKDRMQQFSTKRLQPLLI